MYKNITALFEDRVRAAEEQGTELPNAPATTRELDALAEHIGAPLPLEYRELLSLTDGWVCLQSAGFYEITILSVDDIISGEYDEYMDEIAEEALEQGFERVFPLAMVHEEDTALVLMIRNNVAFTAEAHLGSPDDPEPLLDLLNRYVAEDDEG